MKLNIITFGKRIALKQWIICYWIFNEWKSFPFIHFTNIHNAYSKVWGGFDTSEISAFLCSSISPVKHNNS